MLAAEKDTGLGAAIAFAAAAQSWSGSRQLQSRLSRAVKEAAAPILFIQAENDWNLTPSLVLAREMEAAGKAHKRVIFPPYGNTRADGHGRFCFRATDIWGGVALDFLNASLPR